MAALLSMVGRAVREAGAVREGEKRPDRAARRRRQGEGVERLPKQRVEAPDARFFGQ
jgi:hypothetical protein